MVPGAAVVPAVVTTVVVTLPTVVVVVPAVVAPVAVATVLVVLVPRDKPNLLINWLVASCAIKSPVILVPVGKLANLFKSTETGLPDLSMSTVKALVVSRPESLVSPTVRPAIQS